MIPIPEAMGYQTKFPVPNRGYLLMSCWSGRPRRLSERRLLPLVLDDHRNLMVRSYCWRHHIVWFEDRGKSSRKWSGSFLTGGWLSYAGMCDTGNQGRKVINSLTLLWTFPATTLTCQVRCAYRCHSGVTIVVITNCFLTISEVPSIGGSSYLERGPGQGPMIWEVPDPRGWIYCFHFAKWIWC